MTEKPHSLRTPRGEAGGLGSAKHGAEHWWQQRVTAIALIFLSIYMVGFFFWKVVFGDYNGAIDIFTSPDRATLAILFLAVAFHHGVLGLQVVIEDYVHSEGLKIASILGAKFIAYTFAPLGIICILKILLAANIIPEVLGILQHANR
jgi:succinate dehydrogenase / fumarate reductase membrane anchor subunit